nr:energy-coupling factor transporter transmembrane protein EcfT [Streptomyces sp. F63]
MRRRPVHRSLRGCRRRRRPRRGRRLAGPPTPRMSTGSPGTPRPGPRDSTRPAADRGAAPARPAAAAVPRARRQPRRGAGGDASDTSRKPGPGRNAARTAGLSQGATPDTGLGHGADADTGLGRGADAGRGDGASPGDGVAGPVRRGRVTGRTAGPSAVRRLRSRLTARAPEAARGNALHAGAWWLWALGLATAASRTTNPLLLALLATVAGYVVAARRTDAPWARSYSAFLKLGLVVIAIRLVFSVFLGSPIPGSRVLFTLPEVPLPEWARGVRIGGRVTAEGLVFAFYDGLKLAVLLACVGAANALANPARLLKSLPGALYEAGVAVVVAMTFAPNLVADVVRLRAARRLRGRADRGVRAILQIALPVLEGALERSVALAAAMDARGYGRTARVPAAVRHTTTALTLGGLLGVCAGTYGLLAAEGAGFGLPVLLLGLLAALAGLWLGGRRSVRSRYRPDRWGLRSWLVAGSGAAVAAVMIWSASAPSGTADLHPSVVPLTAPALPLWPAAGVLLGLLPAVAAPAPASRTRRERPDGSGAPPGARSAEAGGPADERDGRDDWHERDGRDGRSPGPSSPPRPDPDAVPEGAVAAWRLRPGRSGSGHGRTDGATVPATAPEPGAPGGSSGPSGPSGPSRPSGTRELSGGGDADDGAEGGAADATDTAGGDGAPAASAPPSRPGREGPADGPAERPGRPHRTAGCPAPGTAAGPSAGDPPAPGRRTGHLGPERRSGTGGPDRPASPAATGPDHSGPPRHAERRRTASTTPPEENP